MSLQVAAARGIAARAILWRKAAPGPSKERPAAPEMLTVVARVSFLLRAGAPTWTASDALAPWSATEPRADQLVPFRPRADVVVSGSALRGMTTVLAYARGAAALLHKTARPTGAPRGELGPVGRIAPPRAGRLGAHDASRFDGDSLVVPADLDPAFFQCAPDDQQIDAIQERDVVRVMGDLPSRWVVEWWVPSVRVEAHMRVVGATSPTFPMRPDALEVDMDRQTVSLVFRGQVAASPVGAPTSLAIGASLSGAPVAWPHFLEPRPRPAIVGPALPAAAAIDGTVMFSDGDVMEARRLAAQHGFVPSKRRLPDLPPPPAPPPPPPNPGLSSMSDGTMVASELEAAVAAARLATPFERQSAPPAPPIADSPFATKFVFDEPAAERPSALPFVAGAAAPEHRSSSAAHVPEPSGTMAFDPELIAALRASNATPFEAPPSASAGRGVPPPAASAAPFEAAPTVDVAGFEAPRFGAPPAREPEAPAETESKGDPFGTMVFGGDNLSLIEAALSMPFRQATEDDVPFQLPPALAAFGASAGSGDIGGTLFTLEKSVPKARVARVVPFRPQRVSAKLVEEEIREGLGAAFLEVLQRISA